jgi:hypothetical protein
MRRSAFHALFPALKSRAKFMRRYASKTLDQRFLQFVFVEVANVDPFTSVQARPDKLKHNRQFETYRTLKPITRADFQRLAGNAIGFFRAEKDHCSRYMTGINHPL